MQVTKDEGLADEFCAGIGLVKFLNHKHVPCFNKFCFIILTILVLATYALNLFDFIHYAETDCDDSHNKASMYTNFIIVLIARFGIFNYLSSEI